MSKGRKTALYIIGLLIIIVSGLLIYIYLNKDLPKGADSSSDKGRNTYKPTTPVEENIVINNDAADYLSLTDEIDKYDITASITKCDCSNVTDESNADNTVCEIYSLDKKAVKSVINKIASAKKYEEVATSKTCAKYNVSVYNQGDELLFNAFEADDTKHLLTGIKGEGFAFDYEDEDITEFLDKLINEKNFKKKENNLGLSIKELSQYDYLKTYYNSYDKDASFTLKADNSVDKVFSNCDGTTPYEHYTYKYNIKEENGKAILQMSSGLNDELTYKFIKEDDGKLSLKALETSCDQDTDTYYYQK